MEMLKNLCLCFAVVLFTACGDDETMGCDIGYYGDDCGNLLQDVFIGTWNGLDCDGDDYSIEIEKGATLTELIVVNSGLNIKANINSETKFTMPTQTLTEPFFMLDVTINGDGTLLEDGTLSFAATVASALGGGECTSVMTKQ